MITGSAKVNAEADEYGTTGPIRNTLLNGTTRRLIGIHPVPKNDLRVGGKFSSRMEAKDGSMDFDFWGIYDEVKLQQLIAYMMGDGGVFKNSRIISENPVVVIFNLNGKK